MWQRIKCFFGFHPKDKLSVYRDPISDQEEMDGGL